MSPPRVLVLEDDPLVRDAVCAALAGASPPWVTLTAGSLAEAQQILRDEAHPLGAAVVDLGLPDGSALALLPQLASAGVVTLVLSARADERSAYDALALGARGYLHKPEGVAECARALRDALDGGAPISPRIARWLVDDLRARAAPSVATTKAPERAALTAREREVLEQFSSGATYAQVAHALGIAVNTVRTHVRSAYEKLQVTTKTEAVLKGLRRG